MSEDLSLEQHAAESSLCSGQRGLLGRQHRTFAFLDLVSLPKRSMQSLSFSVYTTGGWSYHRIMHLVLSFQCLPPGMPG